MKILVCPLDWGLGHAARCIPLIRALKASHEVVVAAGGAGRALLAREFPDLRVLDFPGYRVRYARRALFFFPYLLLQAPFLMAGLRSERRRLEALAAEENAGLVISDGRYGCRLAHIPSVLVTHQLFLRIPGGPQARSLLFAFHARLLRRFSEVWVPDWPGASNLSGELGHGPRLPKNIRYIGPLSRFPEGSAANPASSIPPSGKPKRDTPLIVAAVSGPEPQRSLFEEKLRIELDGRIGTRVLLRGRPAQSPGPAPEIIEGRLNVFDHLDGPALENLFRAADLVVSRSGYTTVMEMAALGLKRVLVVPTPGQTEQEYLADHLQKQGAALRQEQDHLDLESALRDSTTSGFPSRESDDTLTVFLSSHPFLRGPSTFVNFKQIG
jgi:UDP:flavonoid glycosyltransferase YjiC (YdhE family)